MPVSFWVSPWRDGPLSGGGPTTSHKHSLSVTCFFVHMSASSVLICSPSSSAAPIRALSRASSDPSLPIPSSPSRSMPASLISSSDSSSFTIPPSSRSRKKHTLRQEVSMNHSLCLLHPLAAPRTQANLVVS